MASYLTQHPARTRLVALSGNGQDADIQAAIEAGFDEHLTKPPAPARLDQLLARGQASAKLAPHAEADGEHEQAGG